MRKKSLLRALAGETVEPPPFWLMRQAGRYLPEYRETRAEAGSFLNLCYDPKLSIEVSLQPLRRFAPDAVILFSDILVVPHALGVNVRFPEGKGPVLDPLPSLAALPELDGARFRERLAPVYASLRGLAGELGPETALIGFAGAPWTLATYLVEGGASREFRRTKSWAAEEPDGFQILVDRLVEAVSLHVIAQVEAGAEVIQLFDSWAGAVPADRFDRWCIAPVRAIVQRLRAACPGTPVIAFPRGAGENYARYASGTGVDGIGVDSSFPPRRARDELQGICTVQGNLDPKVLLAGGPAMAEAVRSILDLLGAGPFIFNLGHGVLPETPPENVIELAEIVRGWGG